MDSSNSEVQENTSQPTQISFAIRSSTTRVIKTDEKSSVTQNGKVLDFITSISDNKLESVEPQNTGPLVIPLANPEEAAIPLHQRNRQNNGPLKLEHSVKSEDVNDTEMEMDDDEKFRRDVEWRPDSATLEQYESVPVEAIGTALLRGMGWAPGKAIGGVNKAAVQPIEFIAQSHRLGLGATEKKLPPTKKSKRYIKPGDSRDEKPEMELPEGPDGKKRHFKTLDEKLKPKAKTVNGIAVGSIVSVVYGIHEGLYALVVSIKDNIAYVRFPSDEMARVGISDLSKVDTSKLSRDHPALSLLESSNYSSGNKSQKTHYLDSPSTSSKSHKPSSSSSSKSSSSASQECWLRPNIMVRIVSKSFHGAKYYNKKVLVMDVVSRDECVVQIEGGRIVEGVKQSMLETVLPADGGPVIIVRGKRKNQCGTLYQRNRRDETVSVQLNEDMEIVTLSMDDVAQFVGDPEA